MTSILKNRCPYCFRKLNENGDCSKPCAMGALEIEKKRLQAEIEKKRLQAEINKQDKTTENEVGNDD